MIKLCLKHRGVQVLLALFIYLLICDKLPLVFHRGLYTISLFIKDLLVFMLPVTIACFIAETVGSFRKKAPLFICVILVFEALSNFACVWYGYSSGQIALALLPKMHIETIDINFAPLWQIPFQKPSWWSADKGTIVGLIVGLWIALNRQSKIKDGIDQAKKIVEWVLTKGFSRLIPLFILGFFAKMKQTELVSYLFSHYSLLLLWLFLFLTIYIFGLFLLGAGGKISRCLQSIKNLSPAGSLAFMSGCSLSTMPWTIEGTAKNLDNRDLAKAIIPATTNIQQVGDCITNTFLCFLVYYHFYGHVPNITMWLTFSIIFVLARFATAAVLGGAIFIMLPIYEKYLNFNPEMLALILAFNVILDPIVTACNVMGNGALCRVFEKVWSKTSKVFAT